MIKYMDIQTVLTACCPVAPYSLKRNVKNVH